MGTITVRGLTLGEGAPKIAVPLTGATREELLSQARALRGSAAQLAEWRADCFHGAPERAALLRMLETLRAELSDMPLLFTLRTAHEGGALTLDDETYFSLNSAVAESGLADLIDVELYRDTEALRAHIAALRAHAVVIGSTHDFHATPPRAEMLAALCRGRELGADVSKLAVMPHTPADVIALLSVSAEMQGRYPGHPLITISMGRLGALSRVAGETTGSCLTFGTAGQASAPGQLDARTLRSILDALHA